MKGFVMKFEYAIKIKETEGAFLVTCRDFPELLTDGSTEEEALIEAQDALRAVLYTLLKRKEDVPEPTKKQAGEYLISPPVDSAAKFAVIYAAQKANFKGVDLAKELGTNQPEVVRILNLDHKTKISTLEKALKAITGRGFELSF